MTTEGITILHIDDDHDDLFLFSHSISSMYPHITILEAHDGEKGIAILEKLKQESASYPYLIILDMNMPRMDGKQTLAAIRSREEWKDIPIVVFTTSSNPNDVEFCKSYGVDCVTKPIEYAELKDTIKRLLNYINK